MDEDISIPGTSESRKPDEQNAIGFRGNVDHGELIHTLFNNIMYLHRVNQNDQAHELFYNSISTYASLWDAEFLSNCNQIEKKYIDTTTKYRLHVAEFSRLLQRVGISDKPDVRLNIRPAWDVPKDLQEIEDAIDDLEEGD